MLGCGFVHFIIKLVSSFCLSVREREEQEESAGPFFLMQPAQKEEKSGKC